MKIVEAEKLNKIGFTVIHDADTRVTTAQSRTKKIEIVSVSVGGEKQCSESIWNHI